jgi:hypothetical protein
VTGSVAEQKVPRWLPPRISSVEPWHQGVECRVCGRLVAEGSSWQDDKGDRWDAHWDCHERDEMKRISIEQAGKAGLPAEKPGLTEQTGLTAAERSMRARIAANTRWARTEDRSAATRPAREAIFAKFEREVDPEGTLLPQERAKRAENLYKAHMQRMQLKSAQARRRRKG